MIAINNARLFEEVQARTKELTESLEYQTATSEVLGVIARSPNELQPVFDAIIDTAHRLCEAERGTIWQVVGERLMFKASVNSSPDYIAYLRENPIPSGRLSVGGRAIVERRTQHVVDVLADPDNCGTAKWWVGNAPCSACRCCATAS